MAVQNCTHIYLNHAPLEGIETQPAPKQIGAIWGRFARARTQEECAHLLKRLGVKSTDVLAQEEMLPIISKALGSGVKITPSQQDSGVFFLSRKTRDERWETFAVFKAGEKRARMELLARHIAHRVGLEKHAIPGIFCTIAYPRFPEEEEIAVELWNGNVKVYRDVDEKDYNQAVGKDNFGLEEPFTLTGILEPYIESNQEPISASDFARMTCYALCIGLRDGKSNGIAGSMIFDAEDCMPERLFPDSNFPERVAATHLPFLSSDLARESVALEVWEELAKKIDTSIFSLLGELPHERIEFADIAGEVAEQEEINWDHGGCPIEIEEQEQIMESHSAIDVTKTDQLLSDSQLVACMERFIRLRDFLKSQKKSATTLDMVSSVDPLYKVHMDVLQGSRHNPFEVAGRYSPKALQLNLDDEKIQELENARKNTPSPPASWSYISPRSVSSSDGRTE